MNKTPDPSAVVSNEAVNSRIAAACRRIPPLWPLKNFVAVNPFLGLSDRHFVEAAGLVRRTGHGDMLMPAEYYVEAMTADRVDEADFQAALQLARQTLPAGWRREIQLMSLADLKHGLQTEPAPETGARIFSFADFVDERHGTAWQSFIVEEISKWCSAYFDQGQSSWRMPWRGQGLLAAWHAAARLDANPELSGLANFRQLVAGIRDDADKVIALVLNQLGVPESGQVDFLHRQLMGISGWSSHVQFLVREKNLAGQSDNSLVELLAIRLVYDLGVFHQFSGDITTQQAWRDRLTSAGDGAPAVSAGLLTRYLAQQTLECAFQNQLIGRLKSVPRTAIAADRPKILQAIFCIDVRSEVFRRALETQSEAIETLGFAGFFGMTIEHVPLGQRAGVAQLPVLLSPKFTVREALKDARPGAEQELLSRLNFWRSVGGAWNSFKTSAISCFSFVETAGLAFGVKLVRDSLGLSFSEAAFASVTGSGQSAPQIQREACCAEKHGHDLATGIQLADQIALAAGALKNMGLTNNFARFVLICGHGSATVNNPYGSALDCGACGGHAGDVNARVAAAILNNPEVRAGLRDHGIMIPAETHFLAGLHNTTTDEVLLYDLETVSATHAAGLKIIQSWLAGASRHARRERMNSLGLAGTPEEGIDERIFGRSRDWAQVRPEWGLAGNAAFIAAPRARTKGLNLGGRVFLHNYDASRDPDKSVLELIMIAPMVVASWINLQYYGSTVNNRLFGSGNKTIHNVVGTFGIWQGNGGDLQTGLPLQSLHDGEKWVHEPLRLSVFLEASREAINQVIEKHAGVRELVDHGWIHLFALEPSGGCWRYQSNRSWQAAGR